MHPVSSSGAYEAKEPCVFAPLGFQASGLRSMFRSLLPATVIGAAHLRLPNGSSRQSFSLPRTMKLNTTGGNNGERIFWNTSGTSCIENAIDVTNLIQTGSDGRSGRLERTNDGRCTTRPDSSGIGGKLAACMCIHTQAVTRNGHGHGKNSGTGRGTQ